LTFGNSNPSSSSYNSLSDFYFDKNVCEIRIPWYLINIMNPIESVRLADFYAGNGKNIAFEKMSDIKVGFSVLQNSEKKIAMTSFNINNFIDVSHHTRLKKSYYVLQDSIKNVMTNYN
jgi:hypothetical protein